MGMRGCSPQIPKQTGDIVNDEKIHARVRALKRELFYAKQTRVHDVVLIESELARWEALTGVETRGGEHASDGAAPKPRKKKK